MGMREIRTRQEMCLENRKEKRLGLAEGEDAVQTEMVLIVYCDVRSRSYFPSFGSSIVTSKPSEKQNEAP